MKKQSEPKMQRVKLLVGIVGPENGEKLKANSEHTFKANFAAQLRAAGRADYIGKPAPVKE